MLAGSQGSRPTRSYNKHFLSSGEQASCLQKLNLIMSFLRRQESKDRLPFFTAMTNCFHENNSVSGKL